MARVALEGDPLLHDFDAPLQRLQDASVLLLAYRRRFYWRLFKRQVLPLVGISFTVFFGSDIPFFLDTLNKKPLPTWLLPVSITAFLATALAAVFAVFSSANCPNIKPTYLRDCAIPDAKTAISKRSHQ